jgi:hypothetical protein
MTQIRFTLATINKHKLSTFEPPYLFAFRTDWMEAGLEFYMSKMLLERFPSPEFQITLQKQETKTTLHEVINYHEADEQITHLFPRETPAD